MTVLPPALAELDPLSPEAPGRPVLSRCLTLALLLHVLVVVVFGNTPGGTALPGQGVWGAINIRLAGGDPAGRDSATVASDAYSGPEGTAAQRRWGGAVRAPQDLPQAHTEAGAAQLGTWQPQAGELPPADRVETAAAAPPELAPLFSPEAVEPRALPPAPAAPPVRLAPPAPVVDAVPLPAPDLPLPAPTPAPAPAPVAPPPPRPLPPMPRAAPVPMAADRPPLLAGDVKAPLPALPAPAPAPVPPAAEPPRRVAPVLAAPPALAPWAAPALPAPDPAAAAALAPALPAPAPAPAVPAEPPRAVPMPAAPAALAPLTPAALQAPVDARSLPVPDLPALPAAGTPAPPAMAAPPAPAAPRAAVGTAAGGDARPPVPAPGAGAAPRPAPPGPGPGAPDQGARVGHDLATAPSLPASAPRLNLELVRPRGGLISAQGSRGLLPTVPHPPEAKSKLGDEIQKAGKLDCRKAYADMGVAAAAPLVLDALRDKGCRW